MRGIEGLRRSDAEVRAHRDARDAFDARDLMRYADGNRQMVREQSAVGAGVEVAGRIVMTCLRGGRVRFDRTENRLRVIRGLARSERLTDDRRDNGEPHGGDAEPCDEAIARGAGHEEWASAEAEGRTRL